MDDKFLNSLVDVVFNTPELRDGMDSKQEIILRLEIDDDYLQKVVDYITDSEDSLFKDVDMNLETDKLDSELDKHTHDGIEDFDDGNADSKDDEPKDKENAEEEGDNDTWSNIIGSASDHKW